MSNAHLYGPNAVLESSPDKEYDEDTFLYFMDLERARAERSSHPLRLLFATLEPVPGKPAPIPPVSATKLFQSLRLLLRETDIVGWYRQDRVACAVLSERGDRYGADVSSVIQERIGDGIRRRLPLRAFRSLRVRVVQLGPQRLGNE